MIYLYLIRGHYFSLSPYVPFSFAHSQSFPLSLSLSLTLSLALSLSLSLSLTHTLSLTLFLPLSLNFSLSHTLSLALPLSVSFSLSPRIVAHFNATTESITDRLNFPTLDQTQRTVDPFHESSTLLFAPSTSTQIIRKVSINLCYLFIYFISQI